MVVQLGCKLSELCRFAWPGSNYKCLSADAVELTYPTTAPSQRRPRRRYKSHAFIYTK
jgi:hypothetical protein